MVEGYACAVLVPPQDPVALRDALLKLPARRGERYTNPRSWGQTLDGYRALIDELRAGTSWCPRLFIECREQASPSIRDGE